MTALVPAVGDFDFSDDVMAAFGADDSFYFARKHRKEGNRKGGQHIDPVPYRGWRLFGRGRNLAARGSCESESHGVERRV